MKVLTNKAFLRKMALIWLIVAVGTGIFPGTGFSEIDNKTIFQKVRSFHLEGLPKDFISYVEGNVVTQTLKDIPKDEILKPGKPIEVKFYFVRGFGQTIKLCNVSELYTNRLATYIVLLDNINAFLDPSIEWNQFNQLYVWQLVRDKDNFHVVRFGRRSNPDLFFLIFIDKDNYTVNRIARFNNDQSDGRVVIKYSRDKSSGIIFPVQFKGWGMIENPQTNKQERKDFSIDLVSPIRLNSGLSSDCFLDDSCLCSH